MPTIPVNRTAHSRNLTFHDLFEGNEREPEERLESRTTLRAQKASREALYLDRR